MYVSCFSLFAGFPKKKRFACFFYPWLSCTSAKMWLALCEFDGFKTFVELILHHTASSQQVMDLGTIHSRHLLIDSNHGLPTVPSRLFCVEAMNMMCGYCDRAGNDTMLPAESQEIFPDVRAFVRTHGNAWSLVPGTGTMNKKHIHTHTHMCLSHTKSESSEALCTIRT